MKILLLNDNQQYFEGFADALSDDGHEVVEVTTVPSAIKAITRTTKNDVFSSIIGMLDFGDIPGSGNLISRMAELQYLGLGKFCADSKNNSITHNLMTAPVILSGMTNVILNEDELLKEIKSLNLSKNDKATFISNIRKTLQETVLKILKGKMPNLN